MLREAELTRIWYGGVAPGPGLRILAALYGAATALRRWLYAVGWLRRVRVSAPVIVVGNLSAGGTGKTPLTLALVAALRERGLRPGVVSRGFGGNAVLPARVTRDSDPATVGDEPCLIHARSDVPMAVARDRAAASRLLLQAGDEVDCLIADDGLQHYRLERDVEICVIDGKRRFGNCRLLPAGPLREPLERLQRVDFRVCNGGEAQAGEVPMRLRMDEVVSLDGSLREALAAFSGQEVHAVAGIGNPARFFDSLRESGLVVIEHAFADHHAFAPGDLAFADDTPVLMTEKDAVKCRAFARRHWWCVPVTAQLPAEFFDAVVQRMKSAPT
jgi:tetraacyldisaccharide 4'-kinase